MKKKLMNGPNGVYYDQKNDRFFILEKRKLITFIDKDTFKINSHIEYKITSDKKIWPKGCVVFNKNLIYIGEL